MLRWKVGEVWITRVAEILPIVTAQNMFAKATSDLLNPHRFWMCPHFMDDAGNLRMSIHTFVIESQQTRIVVDTCVGNDKERGAGYRLRTPFLEQLEDAGAPADTVDVVLCTHLHFDHVGWNTTLVGRTWVPTFPSARHLFARTEWEYWKAEMARGTDESYAGKRILEDSVLPVVEAGLVDLVDATHAITDDVRLEPAPGHTPGHVCVRISSGGEHAVITGDMIHTPIQMAHPTWCMHVDADQDQTIATRRALLDQWSDSDMLVLGTHFAPPTAGHVVSDGGAWRFEPLG